MGFCQDWEDDYEGLDQWEEGCSPVKPQQEEVHSEDDSPKPIKPE